MSDLQSYKFSHGWRLRRRSKNTNKPGLYFQNIWDEKRYSNKMSDTDVIRLRDWLSVYVNRYIDKNETPLATEIKMKARAIERAAFKLEGQKK